MEYQSKYYRKHRADLSERSLIASRRRRRETAESFGTAVEEMALAIRTGVVSVHQVRQKVGRSGEKLPEIDFIPYVGSFVGTVTEWDLDKRIYKLNQQWRKQIMTKETVRRIKKIMEIKDSVGTTSGQIGDWKIKGYFLVGIEEKLEKVVETIEENTKAIKALAKIIKKK